MYLCGMEQLNLPAYKPRYRAAKRIEIFDPVRRKFVALTPEEWVRQHLLNYLIIHKGYPSGRIGVERLLKVGSRNLRTDVVCYNQQGQPILLAECKAFDVKITAMAYAQLAQYARTLGSKYLLLTNGIIHKVALLDAHNGQYQPIAEIPDAC